MEVIKKKLAESKKINVVLEKQLEKDALFHAFLSNFENHTTLFEMQFHNSNI